MSQWWQILTRRKELDSSSDTQLARVLNVFDLTALGVGSTLGVGVYVLAGNVAKNIAGPSVILSFLIAAIASLFAGLCYAEFGARVPKAGSAYIYSYVTIGEFVAFVIGWNLILEYVIGSASVARGITMYVDSISGNAINSTLRDILPLGDPDGVFADYFDIVSFSITLILGVALAFGLKESKWVNNIFTLLNIGIVLFVIIAGALHADSKNWFIVKDSTKNSTTYEKWVDGFFPFGFGGTISGAATCFYGFVGFDCIATTGEEAKNPRKSIPISIIMSLIIIFLAYFGTSTVLTLMVPYYLQDENAPLPFAFEYVEYCKGKWVVAIGGIFGLLASLFGAMFPLPRIIYAMASDSLIFRFLGRVNKKFKTPVIGTLIAALFTGIMAAVFELKELVNMMSIGTLLAYTIVAACVLLLRYTLDEEEIAERKYALLRHDSDSEFEYDYSSDPVNGLDGEYLNLVSDNEKSFKAAVKQMFNFRKRSTNKLSRKIITIQVIIFCIFSLGFGLCIKFLIDVGDDRETWAIALTSVMALLMLLTLCSIAAQPTSTKELNFKVPFVPFIPAISICINIYLMLMLDAKTWIRFGIWMAIGFSMYGCYGLPNSLKTYQRLE